MAGSLIVTSKEEAYGVVELGYIEYPYSPTDRPQVNLWSYQHFGRIANGENIDFVAAFPALKAGNYLLVYKEIVTAVTVVDDYQIEVPLDQRLVREIPHTLHSISFGRAVSLSARQAVSEPTKLLPEPVRQDAPDFKVRRTNKASSSGQTSNRRYQGEDWAVKLLLEDGSDYEVVGE